MSRRTPLMQANIGNIGIELLHIQDGDEIWYEVFIFDLIELTKHGVRRFVTRACAERIYSKYCKAAKKLQKIV